MSNFCKCGNFTFFLFLCLCLINWQEAKSADRYWVASAAANWNSTANWSTSSGGASGASVPGNSDIAIFDGGGGKNGSCTINVAVEAGTAVAGISITSGYSGTITQGSNNVYVGASHFNIAGATFTAGSGIIVINGNFTVSGGVFTGGAGSIEVNGNFTLSGGSFTSSSTNFYIGGTRAAAAAIFTHSAGTFTHNSGTVSFDPSSACAFYTFTIDILTSTRFYNVTVNALGAGGCGENTVIPAANDSIDVTNNFIHNNGILAGIWDIKGNITCGSQPDGGSGYVYLSGSGAQTYAYTAGRTAHLYINKSGGSVTPLGGTTTFQSTAFTLAAGSFTAPSGTYPIGGGPRTANETLFTHSGGTFTHNSGTFSFEPTNACAGTFSFTIDVNVSTLFYGLTLNTYSTGGCGQNTFIIPAGDSLAAAGPLAITNGLVSTGYLEAQGNVTIASTYDGGTAPLVFSGGSNQNFDLTGAAGIFNNNIKLNKTTGNVTLQSVLIIDAGGQSLALNGGVLVTTASNYLQIADGLTISGGSNSSYVSGPIRKVGNDAFTFPVGKNGTYFPISISAPGVVTDHFTAEFFDTDPHTYGSASDATIDHVSYNEYWTLDRTNGSSNVTVTLSWNSLSEVLDLSTLKIARWNGSAWKDHGNGGTTGNSSSGTIVTSAAVTAFSPFTIASSTAVNTLPLELLNFSAAFLTGSVQLEWTTLSEHNNDYFTIERSTDMIHFEPVQIVDGAGASSTILNYSACDTEPLKGKSYYRLKQTDFNGEYTYSGIAEVELEASFELTVFPNPSANTNGCIWISSDERKEVLVEVYDPHGKKEFSKVVVTELKGSHVIAIDPSQQLSPGLYTIMASSDNEIYRQKLVVIK